jgi:cell division protein FtsW (lipid II flippase)
MLGLAVLSIVMRIDYRHYRNDAVIWSLLGFVGLMLVGVMFSHPVNGSRRWFGVAGWACNRPSWQRWPASSSRP